MAKSTPSPSPSPSSPSAGEDRSAGSSTASSTDSFFADGGGPAFDPDAPPAPAEPRPADQDALVIVWDPQRVRLLLAAQGQLVHAAVAVEKGSGEWVYTDGELGALAEPLTNILNRYDATRAAAATSDELAVIVGLAGYVGRSWGERRAAIARRGDDELVPVSGVHAPEGTGPQDDPEYLATHPEQPPLRTR